MVIYNPSRAYEALPRLVSRCGQEGTHGSEHRPSWRQQQSQPYKPGRGLTAEQCPLTPRAGWEVRCASNPPTPLITGP